MELEYGTITEYFFTTVALAHCGFIPTLHNFTENITIMQDIEKKMEMLDKNSPTCKKRKRRNHKIKIYIKEIFIIN